MKSSWSTTCLTVGMPFSYSSSALIVYSPADMSQLTCRMLGLQHTWQSSTYCWRIPAEESTLVSFHSPHPAH